MVNLQGGHFWVDVATQQRFIDLGIPQNKTQVLGSIKFDISAPEQFIHKAQQLQQDWNLANRKIITIASTHAPEEEKLFLAFKRQNKKARSLNLAFIIFNF